MSEENKVETIDITKNKYPKKKTTATVKDNSKVELKFKVIRNMKSLKCSMYRELLITKNFKDAYDLFREEREKIFVNKGKKLGHRCSINLELRVLYYSEELDFGETLLEVKTIGFSGW